MRNAPGVYLTFSQRIGRTGMSRATAVVVPHAQPKTSVRWKIFLMLLLLVTVNYIDHGWRLASRCGARIAADRVAHCGRAFMARCVRYRWGRHHSLRHRHLVLHQEPAARSPRRQRSRSGTHRTSAAAGIREGSEKP